MTLSRLTLILLAVAILVAPAAAVEVNLTVKETAGVARSAEPVTTGVPFAQGVLADVKALQLKSADGKPMPAQFRELSRWPSGSVRVALLDTQVTLPANGEVKLILTDGKPNVQVIPQGNGVIQQRGAAGQVIIQGGGIQIQGGGNGQVRVEMRVQGGADGNVNRVMIVNGQQVDPTTGQPINQAGPQMGYEEGPDAITLDTGVLTLTVDRKKFNLFQAARVGGKELLVSPAAIVLTLPDGKKVTAGDLAPDEVRLEERGPLRAVILARGKLGGVHKGLLRYTCRITAYAGKSIVKATFWLENAGKYGYTGQGETFVFDALAVELPLAVEQVNCEGQTASGKAFELQQKNETGRGAPNAFAFTMTDGGKSLKSGQRSAGQISLAGAGGATHVAVRHFWQNYEKGLRVTDGTLAIDLWPSWGQWPRKTVGSKSSEGVRQAGAYALPGGVHKRCEMIFDFGGKAGPLSAVAATLDQPLMAMADSAYLADTGALGTFAPAEFKPADANSARLVDRWNTWARNVADPKHPKGVIGARETCGYGPFFGWMDFGELYWQPGSCQLHYDWTWVMLLNYVRLGERDFLDRAAEMAQHRIDVDQLWTDRDLPLFNYLTRYEKGYADIHWGVNDGHFKPITSHNWARGMVWWYYLTGDESAREAAIKNAQGIKSRQVDQHANDAEGKRLGDQPRCSSWAIECLCDVYDMTGDRQYLDQALVLWNMHLKKLWQAKGANYGMTGGNTLQFYYGAEPLVMLHQRSGEADLLDYMRALCDYADDPAVWTTYVDDMASNLTNVYAYVGLIDKNPARLARARELFANAMKHDAGLALWTGTGAYTKEVAKKLRNGHVWLWAEREAARKK